MQYQINLSSTQFSTLITTLAMAKARVNDEELKERLTNLSDQVTNKFDLVWGA